MKKLIFILILTIICGCKTSNNCGPEGCCACGCITGKICNCTNCDKCNHCKSKI